MCSVILMELHSTKLLDRVKEEIRYKYYDFPTEEVALSCGRYLSRIHWPGHPNEMTASLVEVFWVFS